MCARALPCPKRARAQVGYAITRLPEDFTPHEQIKRAYPTLPDPKRVRVQVGYAITRLPEDFTPHKQIKRVYEQRRKMIESGEGLDWAMAEALAFGTLLSEGAPCAWLYTKGCCQQ